MSAPATMPRDPALAAYVAAAKMAPYLSAEDELHLARRAQAGDRKATDRLATAHLRLSIKTAVRYRGYGLPLTDLIGEANVGLMQAIQRFEPERGWRFATYALWWIRSAIQEHILHERSLIKFGTTAAQKKLFWNLPSLAAGMGVHDGDLSSEQVAHIAHALDVPAADVVSMHRRMMAPEARLNDPVAGGDGESCEFQDLLADDSDSADMVFADDEQDADRAAMVRTALATLQPLDRDILIARRLRGTTLDELANAYRVSRERIRQIEVRAFEKLQRAVELLAAERRRKVMERKPWAMVPVKLAPPDPEREAREIAESEAARPRRCRKHLALAA